MESVGVYTNREVPYIAFRQLTPLEKLLDGFHERMARAYELPLQVLFGRDAPSGIYDRDPGDEHTPPRWTVRVGPTWCQYDPSVFGLTWTRFYPPDDGMGDLDSVVLLADAAGEPCLDPEIYRCVRGYYTVAAHTKVPT